MDVLRTSRDLGLVIRQRRKALRWDQAQLAERVGVSRQWLIEMEKGKPRAELQLVLRTLNVLGLVLTVDTVAGEASSAASSEMPLDLPDINTIVDGNRLRPNERHAAAATPKRSTRSRDL
ncbi:helix-turn-helix transcriptional regulator [Stenotrophomonas geniculata]|jgi:HTH-type transcriptional regulator/antitoxin HipB|nr:helix-turn-helix transcriptional regulator [Stenotrophomonas geniculata]MCR1806895.1 helix-turn-helix transcriptional regulator [Stenotrophomonas geniculata]